MTRSQANHLVEGERVKTEEFAGPVVGTTKLRVDPMGRTSYAGIFTTDQHRLADGAPTVERVEDRDAIRSAHPGFAIDR